MTVRERYKVFLGLVKEIHDLEMADMILSWDQQTYMPEKGANARASQLGTLAGLGHNILTGDRMADLLAGLDESEKGGLDEDARVNVREIRRLHKRSRNVPTDLVKELTSVQALSQSAWIDARQQSDYSAFSPWLKKILGLKLQVADAVGYGKSRYDALVDEFEPGATAAWIAEIFNELKKDYIPFVHKVLEAGRRMHGERKERIFPIGEQRAFSRTLLGLMNFDMKAGRLDVSAHPFTSGNCSDVRLTTRYDEKNVRMSIFGTMHEGGHGLYEQGLDPKHEGTPRATSASLGIHESQSRMWENMIGRSRAFWGHALPLLKTASPRAAADLELDDWYRDVNRVEASLIRVEADEVTYNLHIILRFEIEREMIENGLPVEDIPEIWNSKMKEYLGITPPDAAQGVLQDIHWAMGAIGYFPTYALGNIYAAQFYHKIRQEIPDLDDQVGRCELRPLLDWLRKEIHLRGQTYRATDLVRIVTGESLSSRYLMRYLEEKYGELYGL